MAEKRRINLSLNLNLPLQRQTWEIIRKIPAGRRTEEICRMICNYTDKQQEKMLKQFRRIIREELSEVKVTSNVVKSEKNEVAEPQSVSSDVLGFLLSLQGEGDDG